jgi:Cd2+/Zn2+-exporting ATPase
MSASHSSHDHGKGSWQTLAWLALSSGLLGISTWWSQQHLQQPILETIFIIAAFITGGWEALEEGWHALHCEKRIDVHVLMLLAAIGAWIVGQPLEGVLLLFLFSTAGALEHYAMERTRKAIDTLLSHAPKEAHQILPDGTECTIEVAKLQPEDRIIVRPGELIPADGIVLEGESATDESSLTGETRPVSKQPQDVVASGTLNTWGRLVIKVTHSESESTLFKIIKLIREAQANKAPIQNTIDRWGDRYAIFTLSSAVLLFGVLWATGHSITTGENSALYRAMTLLVALSPCALVLSVPSAVLAAIAVGARQGILFRGGSAIERLAEVNCVGFDKTGTLTEGNPSVAALETWPADSDRAQALNALFSLEADSTHPFATGIVKACQEAGARKLPVQSLTNVPGHGITGTIEQAAWKLGTKEFVGVKNFPALIVPSGAIVSEVWASNGHTTVRVTLVDRIRTASTSTISGLHTRKIRTIMLTGDREEAASVTAQKVGIQTYQAGLSPEQKMRAIKKLSQDGYTVAMVGDGINDAPSLTAADVAIGMGGRGSDAALESSDLVLTGDRLELLITALELSTAARQTIRINITLAIGAALSMALLVIFHGAPLTAGVMVHEGSTVIVCLNGLRLLNFRKKTIA